MELEISDNIKLSVQTIMTGRGCIIGQSGSGKSFLMGITAEELGKKGMPFCIIDTEGEYASLKSVLPYLIIIGGDKADLPITIDLFNLFKKSISLSVPIILDVSDVVQKQEFVYKALTILYKLEEDLRKPFLVLIEEADKFAPQIVHQKINIIEELSVRGRKRGIGLLIATQRPSNISKNVLSQCSYGFIGKLTIENDLNAISQLFSNRSALDEIVNLTTGEFMPFGIDFKEKFKVKPRTSFHMGSTPQIGELNLERKVNLNSFINELKTSTTKDIHEKENTKLKSNKIIEKSISAEVFSQNFSESNAKEFAEKMQKKMFGIFGRKTESIKEISLKYIPLALCNVRVPTKNKREFEVYNITLNSEGLIVTMNNSIKLFKPPFEYSKLSSSEEQLLYQIKTSNGIKKLDLENKTNIKRNTFNNLIRFLYSKKLIKIKNEKIFSDKYYQFTIKNQLSTNKEYISSEVVLGEKPTLQKVELYLKNIFPKGIIANFSYIYLPFYEITLLHKNKIRIFKFDAIFGSEMI